MENRVKFYRNKKRISQETLAQRAGVTRQTISQIENERYNPSLNICLKICRVLGVDLNTLFWTEQ